MSLLIPIFIGVSSSSFAAIFIQFDRIYVEFRLYKTYFSTAKKQKLKECMEDEDHCPNVFGPCNPEHTDQCIDLVGKGMSY